MAEINPKAPFKYGDVTIEAGNITGGSTYDKGQAFIMHAQQLGSDANGLTVEDMNELNAEMAQLQRFYDNAPPANNAPPLTPDQELGILHKKLNNGTISDALDRKFGNDTQAKVNYLKTHSGGSSSTSASNINMTDGHKSNMLNDKELFPNNAPPAKPNTVVVPPPGNESAPPTNNTSPANNAPPPPKYDYKTDTQVQQILRTDNEGRTYRGLSPEHRAAFDKKLAGAKDGPEAMSMINDLNNFSSGNGRIDGYHKERDQYGNMIVDYDSNAFRLNKYLGMQTTTFELQEHQETYPKLKPDALGPVSTTFDYKNDTQVQQILRVDQEGQTYRNLAPEQRAAFDRKLASANSKVEAMEMINTLNTLGGKDHSISGYHERVDANGHAVVEYGSNAHKLDLFMGIDPTTAEDLVLLEDQPNLLIL
jgi:hypothetical protein